MCLDRQKTPTGRGTPVGVVKRESMDGGRLAAMGSMGLQPNDLPHGQFLYGARGLSSIHTLTRFNGGPPPIVPGACDQDGSTQMGFE